MAPDGNFKDRKKIWWSLVFPLMPPPIIRHFVVLMLELGFGQNSQCPGGFTTINAAVGLGAGSCPNPILELLFVMAEGKSSPCCLCLHIPHCHKALLSSSLPTLWRRDAKLTSWLSFAQWSSFLYLFPSLSLPLYMIFVFGKQLQISLVVFCHITVIIAYTANYTKSDLMEVIY